MKKFIIVGLITALAASFLPAPVLIMAYDTTAAQNYLLQHNSSPWSVMALSVLGASSVSAEHLKNLQATTAIEYAAPILAITAINEDPRSFGGKDLVSALKSFHQDGQIGVPETLNDDIFGILALRAVGLPTSDPAIAETKIFLTSRQRADGGWGFTIASASDTNMTAGAVLALLASGLSGSDTWIQNALGYLRSAQNADGGFPYDPKSTFGTASDTSSTAWVVWALNALGIAPATWEKNGKNPTDYLAANQQPQGFFAYQLGSNEDSFSPITTAYAVIALGGKSLPLRILEQSEQSFAFRIEGSRSQVCAGKTAGPTALDIVKNASFICGFSYEITQTSFGPYLKRINDDTAVGLTGWLYLVDFISPDIGAADYILEPGDEVLWFFGEFQWQPSRLTLSKTVLASGESAEAIVEFWSGTAWQSLGGATVAAGDRLATTDSAGRGIFPLPDGIYQVSAKKDGFVRSNRVVLQVGTITRNKVALEVTVQPGDAGGERIGFVVEPSFLDFGNLKAGAAAKRDVTLRNIGTVAVHLESQVAGDELFRQNLEIAASPWQNFALRLQVAQSAQPELTLSVPSGYPGEGIKSGELTFWAVVR